MKKQIRRWQRNTGPRLFTVYGCSDLRAPAGATILERRDASSQGIGLGAGVLGQTTVYRYRGKERTATHQYNHCTGEIMTARERL